MKQYCFGIDVGGTSVKCGLFETDGSVVEKWEIPTRVENQGEAILPDVAETILKKIEEKSIDKETVVGVGIGIPGPVNENGEVECAVNLHWGYKDIARELHELTGLTAKAGNDANVAALGEAWKGSAEGARNLFMVTLGTGVGGGVIVDGHIVAGSHGAGGEIGHACVNPEETETCNCGNQGCLEQVASATGIVRLAKKELEENPAPSVLRDIKVSAKSVFDAYKEGDDLAVKIVNRFANHLGRALANFACVIDPQVIVIGGGVSKAGEVLVDVVGKYFRRYAFSSCKETPIVIAELGNDAGICGAAKLVLG